MPMAYRVNVDGANAKIRKPWAVGMVGVITGLIYTFAWYYNINRELREFGSARGDRKLAGTKPAVSLLATTVGAVVYIPAIVSWVRTVRRLQEAQRVDHKDPISWGPIVLIAIGGVLTFGLLLYALLPYLLQVHLNRLWAQELPSGPVNHSSSVKIDTREASFAVPEGWAESTPEELDEQQADENERAKVAGQGNGGTIYAALYRPDFINERPYVIRVLGWPTGSMPAFNPERWAAGIASASGLDLVGGVSAIRFGDEIGYLWYLKGLVDGAQLQRPEWGTSAIHRAEMFAPTGRLIVRQIAPQEQASEAIDALRTFLSSWRWGIRQLDRPSQSFSS